MENFDHKGYRENLAKDLREIKKNEPTNADSYLKNAQTTTNYKKASVQHVEELRLDKERKIMLQEKYMQLAKILNEQNMHEFIFLKKLTGIPPSQEVLETCFNALKSSSQNAVGEFKELLEESDNKYVI